MSLPHPHLSAPALPAVSRWTIPAAVGAVAIFLLAGSYFVVPQTDVAFVKRFGKVLSPRRGRCNRVFI